MNGDAMTDHDKELIRNRTPGFLIFNGQAVRHMACNVAIRESNPAFAPVMLERVFSESS